MLQLGLFTKLGIAAGLIALVAAGYAAHRSSLIELGYQRGLGEIREAQNERLRESLKETSRLLGLVKGLQDEYQASQREVDALRERLLGVDAQQRLREQEHQRDLRIASASAESLRRYAKTIDGYLGGCRADLARFGLEATKCSVAAHTLKGYIDQVCHKPP